MPFDRSVARDDFPVLRGYGSRRIGARRSRTVGALPGYDQVDAVGDEFVALLQMEPDLGNQLPGMVPDGPTATADEVELVVGMGDLPSGRLVDTEMGTTHQIEFLEDR